MGWEVAAVHIMTYFLVNSWNLNNKNIHWIVYLFLIKKKKKYDLLFPLQVTDSLNSEAMF